MAKQRSARDRNAEIRRQQQKLSEERRNRSLRQEDFGFIDEPMTPRRDADRVQFRSMASAPRPSQEEQEETVRPRESRRRIRKTRPERVRRSAAAPAVQEVPAEKRRERRPKEKTPLADRIAKPLARVHESDFAVIAAIILLCFIGLVMITSSSYYYAYNNMGDPLYFLKRQCIALAMGFAGLIVAMYFSMELFRKLAWAAYFASLAAAVAVLAFGVSVNGSSRWLAIGPIQFQPAELVKLGVALFMAVKVEQYQKHIEERKTFFKLLFLLLIPTGLVAYQNLTSGIIIMMIGLTIMFIGGCRWRYFLLIGLLALAVITVFVIMPVYVPLSKFPGFIQPFIEKFMYRANRVKAFMDPFRYAQNEGYQIVQSLYAIGSGGFFGNGLGESIQKLGFIPEAYNDIIFAIICEELGLLGAGMVILLFGIIAWQGAKIAVKAPDAFTTYLAAGLVVQVGLQAVLNIAVSTNSIPATGVSLPFISYGGSSILFLMISMGLLLNISRRTYTEAPVRSSETAEPRLFTDR